MWQRPKLKNTNRNRKEKKMKTIIKKVAILLISLPIAIGLSANVTWAVPPLEVVNTSSGVNPIRPNGAVPAGFVGYFSPKPGEPFQYKNSNNELITETCTEDGGGRFGDKRPDKDDIPQSHDGLDLIGWVEKVSSGGNPPGFEIHLFDTSWNVYPIDNGNIRGKDTDGLSIRIPSQSPPGATITESYQHLTDITNKTIGDALTINDKLGTLEDRGSIEFTHLHYGVTNINGEYINPIGNGWETKTVFVPEPATMLLLTLGGLILRKKR
jgi:hypothetical protein